MSDTKTAPSEATTSPDVLVIGGGAAGAMAALEARRRGATVALVHRAGGATQAWSGAIDVADALVDTTPGAAAPTLSRGPAIVEALQRLAATRGRHPYARLCSPSDLDAEIADAIGALQAAVPGLDLVRRADGHNHVVATTLGTVKRTAWVPQSQLLDLVDLASSESPAIVGIVEWMDLAGFNARPVVEMLEFATSLGAPKTDDEAPAIRFVAVRVPRQTTDPVFATTVAMARALDDNRAEARGVESRRDAYILALKEALKFLDETPTHLLTPPVLGISALDEDAVAAIDMTLGTPIRELLALPPSAPGERLQRGLREACNDAGIHVIDGVAETPVVQDGRVTSVTVKRGAERTEMHPRAVVLATGRFFGGGIRRDHTAEESVFGLPVFTDGQEVADQFIGNLTDPALEGAHAIFRAGVTTDIEQRPLTSSRAPLATNLFAAGTVSEGYDPARDGSGLAVALWTGKRAGAAAAEASKA